MKAAVCRAFGAPLQIEDVVLAPPGPHEIAVDVRACAICHSDIHAAEGAWGGRLPAIYGHEAAGVVRTVGAAAEGIAVGDHVVVTLIRSCGHCFQCSRGDRVLCESTFAIAHPGPLTDHDGGPIAQGINTGAFAEQVVVHASQVAVIDRDVPFDVAALLGCGVITGFGAAVNTAGVGSGDSVVVIGAGGVGLNAIQGARIAGAHPLVALDPAPSKRAAALRFGATHALDAAANDVAEAVRALTGGRGADHALVTVGSGAAAESALALVRPGGQTVIVGMPASGVKVPFEMADLAFYEHRIIGSKMGSTRLPVDIPALTALYRAGRLKLDELITARYPLEQINEAIRAVTDGTALRNVIEFPG
jgi:S-(hydroxymethyl)glutathione dehydrogenase / alcohol dehydrogenase